MWKERESSWEVLVQLAILMRFSQQRRSIHRCDSYQGRMQFTHRLIQSMKRGRRPGSAGSGRPPRPRPAVRASASASARLAWAGARPAACGL